MPRLEPTQLNIRSRFARDRATALARQTGLTTTEVVEEALRAYSPPGRGEIGGRLQRRGVILIKPADGDRVTLADANAALDEVRGER